MTKPSTSNSNDRRSGIDDRRSGPKRSEASQKAIEKAAIVELNEHGWRDFSIDRVSKRAKASKQTIYRWWDGAALLVVDAVLDTLPESEETGDTAEERVVSLIRPLINVLRSGDGAHIWRGVLLASADDPEASEVFRQWIQNKFRQPLRHILAREANLGRIRRDWDIDFALELTIGPLWQRLLGARGPIPERYAERLAEALIAYHKIGAPKAS